MGMGKFGGRKGMVKSEVIKFANQNMSRKTGNHNCWEAIEGDNRNIEIPRKMIYCQLTLKEYSESYITLNKKHLAFLILKNGSDSVLGKI